MSAAIERVAGELPLDRYAALGDGRSVALVAADGSIDWWCVPNMDSTPFFDRILDANEGGHFAITPTGPFTVERQYRAESNVLEHVYTTATGRARVTDSLNGGLAGILSWRELARRIEGLEGTVDFQIQIRFGRRFDDTKARRESSAHGDVWHVGDVMAGIRSTDGIAFGASDDRGASATILTHAQSRDTIALLANENEPLVLPTIAQIDTRIDRSDRAWREWTEHLHVDGPYASVVKRSALALKLLVFSPTGAIAAAATTSLPERLGGDKNYDYRYAWSRDVAFTIKAFLRVGATGEAMAAFLWLLGAVRANDDRLCTMYTLDTVVAPQETYIDVPGYAASRPIRVGNRARDQTQLGIYNDVLETAACLVAGGHVLDSGTRALLGKLTDACLDLWSDRDSGIWELVALEHYTISKISCWAACDCALELARKGEIDASSTSRWERERERIADWIDANCWSPKQNAYTMYPGTERLDAAFLLATRFGAHRPERFVATRDAIAKELARGPLVYRYSGMEREEGTFIACGFWLAETYALFGDVPRAHRQMDSMIAACDADLGLYAEQLDATTGEMLGNMPQALSHLALVLAATAIAEAEARHLDSSTRLA